MKNESIITAEYFDQLILGKDAAYSSNSAATGLNNNILVVGGSGTGKTTSVVVPRILEAHSSSLVISLSKRIIADLFAPILEARGYQVIELDFASPARSSSNVGWDPLTGIQTEQDIALLARALVDPTQKEHTSADPYWDNTAISLLTAFISYVLETESNPSFTSVLDLLRTLEFIDTESIDTTVTNLDKQFSSLAKKNPGSYAVNNWLSFHNLPLRTSLCVYSDLKSAFDKCMTSGVKELMSKKSKLDFERVGKERTALFIITSPVNPALYHIVNVLQSQLINSLFQFAALQANGSLPVPVQFVYDDFALGGKITNFVSTVASCRASKISFMLLLQSLAQLDMIYGPASSRVLIENMDSLLFMGCNDLETAQQMAYRFDVTMQDMLQLPLGWQYIYRRGEYPVCCERYPTTYDPRYQAVVAAYERKATHKTSSDVNGADRSLHVSEKKPPVVEIKTQENTSLTRKPVQDSAPEKTTSALEDLIEATKSLAISFEASGRFNELVTQLKELAELYYQYYGETNKEAQAQVLKLACKLVDIGAYQTSLRMLDRLYPLSVRACGDTDESSLKTLALLSIAAEKAGERRKARSCLAKLKTYEKNMPILVRKTEAVCRQIREGKK